MRNLARSTIRILAITTFAGALVLVRGAGADDGSAADHGKRARIAYDLQDWSLAAQEFRSAYSAEQKAEYLFGLAQSQRQGGDYAAAIASFKAYKRLDTVTSEQATAAELLITKCEAERAKDEAETLRKIAASSAPPSPSASSRPPTSVVTQRATGPMIGQSEELARGPKHFYSDALGDSLFLLGLGSAGLGTFLLVSGNTDMNGTTSQSTEGAAAAGANSAHSKQVLGAVALPIGGALLALAIWRWTTVVPSESTKSSGVLLGPSYLGYVGQF